MATHLRVTAILLWFAFALSALSICRGAVSGIATQDFFNGIISAADDGCAGNTFYTYSDFINAANSFPSFGTTGTSDDNKREIAASFANVAHEITNLCFVEEIAKGDYCDSSNTQYPCASSHQYYGRGPLQLTGRPNLVENCTLVVECELPYCDYIRSGIWCNGPVECNGGNSNEVNNRISHYTNYCSEFGVDPGTNLSC